jgi:hypothetical protein
MGDVLEKEGYEEEDIKEKIGELKVGNINDPKSEG